MRSRRVLMAQIDETHKNLELTIERQNREKAEIQRANADRNTKSSS
jgi:hypothetical protein